MTALLFALALLSAPAQVNAQHQVSPTYRMSGVVVNAVTNAPVPRAQVSISLANEQTSTTAGDDGRFVFEGLSAGKYTLNAAAQGYVREAYGQHGRFFVGVAVGDGLDSEHLIFRLQPQAVIYGRVTDGRGSVVRGALVLLFTSDLMRGSHQKFDRMQAQTNDLGQYRFAHLLPGKYSFVVQAQPWYAQPQLSGRARHYADSLRGGRSTFVSSIAAPRDSLLDVVYPVTFYPGVTEESAAGELLLSAGDKQEANITLQAVPAVHLYLTALPSDLGTSFGIGAHQKVFGTFDLGLSLSFSQVAPGEYEVAGLPPAGLTLVFTTNNGKERTMRTIEADTRSGETFDVSESQLPAKVSGRILVPNGVAEAKAGSVSLVGTPLLPGATAEIQKDGTFHFHDVHPGTYRVQVNLHIGGYYVQKVSAKEAKASGHEVTIPAENDVDLTVTLGQGEGQVSGVVQWNGRPTAGVMVLLVPESGLEMEDDSRMDESDSDGTFSLRGILPGDYVLLAINDGWDLEWANPAVLKPYLSAGQKLSIGPNQSLKATLSVQERALAQKELQ